MQEVAICNFDQNFYSIMLKEVTKTAWQQASSNIESDFDLIIWTPRMIFLREITEGFWKQFE